MGYEFLWYLRRTLNPRSKNGTCSMKTKLSKRYKIIECRKGSAEDELTDSEIKLAKLRPMRVEMYGMNWNR